MSELKCSMVGEIFSEMMDKDFLESDFINYIFIVLLNPNFTIFLPGAGLGFEEETHQLQTTKEAEKLQTVCAFNWNVGGVPVLFMYVRMPVYFFESNLWSGPLCGIARNSLSILFEIRFYEKVSLEKLKAGMLCGFGL